MIGEHKERLIECSTGETRIWEKGEGLKLGYFAGHHGLPRWQPVLDELSRHRNVVAPSLPGYPGGSNYQDLDDVLDWGLAVRDIHVAAELDGADLVGTSIGATLAADIAAIWPGSVGKLILIAPYGHFDEDQPVADIFAQYPDQVPKLLSSKSEDYSEYIRAPDDEDEVEWDLTLLRSQMAAAQMLWPLGDTGILNRLSRISQPTLLVWGSDDQIIPPSYAEKFANAIIGDTKIKIIEGAGHKVEFDAPEEVAGAIYEFLDDIDN